MRIGGRVRVVLLVVLGMVAAVVATTMPAPGVVEAAPPAPLFPTPQCTTLSNGSDGPGCIPLDSSGSPGISGTFASGGSFTITTNGGGLGPCATYVSTGCYYDLYSPSFVRCVYLHDGDPADVRSCGSLSTQGGVYSSSAQRQGSCSGGLGGTYVYGGPANDPSTYWTARAPKLAACEFEVSGTYPIDNLYGPTFFLVRTSVDECIEPGGGYGCDESWATLERRYEYGWLPVEGTLAPRASFDADQLGPDGDYLFRNTSVQFDGGVTWEWSFGDGGTSTAESPTHQYTDAGRYTVRLTMRSAASGASRTYSETIDLEAPDLTLTVYNPDAEFGPGKAGNRFDLGDEFNVRIIAQATEGFGSLQNVAPVAELLTLPEQLELVDEPLTVAPQTFAPGATQTYDVKVRAVGAGRVTLRSTWNGDDFGGDPSGPWVGSFDASVTGLKVEIIPDPDQFKRADTNDDGDIDADDNHVDVEVKVTNVTEATIADVTKGEVVVTSRTDDVLPQFMLVSSPVDDPNTTEVDEGDFGDLGPGESKSLTWTYGAEEALHVDVSMLVTGDADGTTVTALGEAVVKAFDNVVLEAKIDVVDAQSFQSGKPIRIDGTFTNLTDRPEAEEELDISFAIAPKFSEAPGSIGSETLPLNGAGGYFGAGGRTAEGVERFELGPGESTTLRAVVETLATELPTGFTVEYTLVASVKETDPDTGAVSWTVLDELEIDLVEKDGFSAEHSVTLGPVPKEYEDTNFFSCDPEVLWTAEYIGCKLVRGVETAARGFGALLQLGWKIAHGTVAAYGYVLGTAFELLMQDAEGRAAIAAEIVGEMQALKELGHQALQSISAEQIALLVPSMLDQGFTRLHNAWCGRAPTDPVSGPCNGSPGRFAGELAEVAGENIDMVLEALVAARGLAKVSRALAAGDTESATVLQRLWAKRAERGLADADEVVASQGPRALPGSRVLPAGVDVTDLPKIWRDAYGLSQRQFEALQKVAKEYGVNITFRSRAPGSIDLIEANRALPKPQGIKTKGVNDIDVEFLGYDDKYRDLVVHMEPPIPFNRNYDDLGAVAENYADQVLRSKRPDLAPGSPEFIDLRAQIKERVITRHDEWGKLTGEYWNALRRGDDGRPIGVKVDFDGDFNGAPGERLRYEENRAIQLNRVEPGPEGAGRRLYEVKLQAPPGHPRAGEFLDVTGDVDFLGILKPDGTVLGANGDPAELAKRLEIYELMRLDPISMQHGESFTIAKGESVRARYLRDGVDAPGGETTLTVTPEQKMITTYFDDGLSTLKVGRNTIAEFNEARAFFRGVFSELASPDRSWSRAFLEQLVELRTLLRTTIPTLFDVSLLDQYVAALAGLVADAFSRDGEVVRPDGGGGLERYVPAGTGDQGSASLVSLDAVSAASATGGVVDELDEILDELEAAGVPRDPAGAAGGRWVPVDVDDVLTDGSLSLAPYAYLATGASAGDTTIVVTSREQLRVPASSEWFEVGDEVVLDPGGPYEEVARVASLSPFTLASPLENTHDELTMVVTMPEDAGDGGGPVDPPPSGSEAALFPVEPARLLETRRGTPDGTVDGTHEGAGAVAAGSVTEVQVTGRAGVPVGAAAVAVNLTAIRPDGRGYFTLFPCDADQPFASSINFEAGDVKANSAVAPLSSDGRLCVFSTNRSHVAIDVNGYLADVPSFSPLVAARVLETRPQADGTIDGESEALGRLAAGSTTTLQVTGRGGVPAGSDAVSLNLTAIRPDERGYLTLYPCDAERPDASSLNYEAGSVTANSAMVALSDDGEVCIFTSSATDLAVDVNAALLDDDRFDPLVAARLLETRSGTPTGTIDGVSEGAGALAAGEVVEVQVTGRGGVPDDAVAAAVTVAAVRPGDRGYLTLFPCGDDPPTASNLNFVAGQNIANSAIAKLSDDGKLCVFASQPTHLLMDVNAAWAA